MHGFYQIAGKVLQPIRQKFLSWTRVDQQTVGYHILQSGLTFGLVTLAWIFFRAPSLRTALSMVKRLLLDFQVDSLLGDSLYTLGLNEKNFHVLLLAILLLLVVELFQLKYSLRESIDRQPLPIRWGLIIGLICVILVFGVYGPNVDESVFIYAQF